VPRLPRARTNDRTNWRSRNDYDTHANILLLEYFKSTVIKRHGRSIGCTCIPLLYVIRESNEYGFDDNYAYLRTKLVNCTQLRGPAYQADNGNVLSIFVQHTKNTEIASMVKSNQRRRYGHKAFLYFEGNIYKECVAQEASSILHNSMYNGPWRNFTFGDY